MPDRCWIRNTILSSSLGLDQGTRSPCRAKTSILIETLYWQQWACGPCHLFMNRIMWAQCISCNYSILFWTACEAPELQRRPRKSSTRCGCRQSGNRTVEAFKRFLSSCFWNASIVARCFVGLECDAPVGILVYSSELHDFVRIEDEFYLTGLSFRHPHRRSRLSVVHQPKYRENSRLQVVCTAAESCSCMVQWPALLPGRRLFLV